jgi:hypothetical protein
LKAGERCDVVDTDHARGRADGGIRPGRIAAVGRKPPPNATAERHRRTQRIEAGLRHARRRRFLLYPAHAEV